PNVRILRHVAQFVHQPDHVGVACAGADLPVEIDGVRRGHSHSASSAEKRADFGDQRHLIDAYLPIADAGIEYLARFGGFNCAHRASGPALQDIHKEGPQFTGADDIEKLGDESSDPGETAEKTVPDPFRQSTDSFPRPHDNAFEAFPSPRQQSRNTGTEPGEGVCEAVPESAEIAVQKFPRPLRAAPQAAPDPGEEALDSVFDPGERAFQAVPDVTESAGQAAPQPRHDADDSAAEM